MERHNGGCQGENSKGNIFGYMKLAAAIYKSGVRERDKRFLESDWASELKGIVADYVDIQSHKYDLNIMRNEE